MGSLSTLANKLYELRDEKSELNNKLSELKKEIKTIEAEMLEELSQEGMNRVDLEGKASFFVATRKFYRIDDRDQFMQFLEDQGDDDILTVQHQTLNAYAKEIASRKAAEGTEEFEIPGLVYHSQSQIKIRKAKS